jgi:hypothetical protein
VLTIVFATALFTACGSSTDSLLLSVSGTAEGAAPVEKSAHVSISSPWAYVMEWQFKPLSDAASLFVVETQRWGHGAYTVKRSLLNLTADSGPGGIDHASGSYQGTGAKGELVLLVKARQCEWSIRLLTE